jgi:4-alpha-glucanotransferase
MNVARSYTDALGQERIAPADTVTQFEELLEAERHAFVAPSRVLRVGDPVSLDVTLPAVSWTESVRWTFVAEDGDTDADALPLRDAPVIDSFTDAATSISNEAVFDTRRLTFPIRPKAGVHALTLIADPYARATVHLIVVPARAFAPVGRSWGISAQIYTLRSQRNLGVGDFADLRALCALVGERGASYVGINPLHAGFRNDPEAASPYAASSRRWLNWLAIAVDDVPESRDPSVQRLLADPATAAEIARLRALDAVDYAGVAAMKDALLRACFAALPNNAERAAAFASWCHACGEPLTHFAAFEVLSERFGRAVRTWPDNYARPDLPDVALYAAASSDRIHYSMYLQWLAAEQLAAVSASAAAAGVALYRDLAVGVDADSADVWTNETAYVSGVSVGAPPDELNTRGQDWGLPAHHPGLFARDGYSELLGLLADNCRDAGALRIDHAFSLARLYWIPRGGEAHAGTYVDYPLDDLRGIVALASERAQCVVIGEDLGTVPSGFRESMEATGILSYRILFFEREADGSYIAPEAYPALALAASGTHDLPTIPAWLRGDDITLRSILGLLATPVEAEQAARERERTRLLDALVAHGDLAAAERNDEISVVVAANRYLAASPAAIVMAQLDDILGERMPVNVPGTSTQYPNWRRKLDVDVAALGDDPRLERLCRALAEVRPRPPR